MQTFDTSILAVETSTLSAGLRALNFLGQENLRVLDSSHSGEKKFLILLSGVESALQSALDKMSASADFSTEDFVDRVLVSKASRSLLEAVYSLTPQKVEQSLLIIETETVSICLSLANKSIRDHLLAPIEFRIIRSGKGGAYSVLTGSIESVTLAADDCRAKLCHDLRSGSIEVIDAPTDAVRAMFSFE